MRRIIAIALGAAGLAAAAFVINPASPRPEAPPQPAPPTFALACCGTPPPCPPMCPPASARRLAYN